ncbi:hypothetical protein GF337_14690 [candidate division KSB1 bacterium]|nr:hypothetical protein [candidate division KSB1 bacterium]
MTFDTAPLLGVNIAIYNLLGQRVRFLENSLQQSGSLSFHSLGCQK